MIFGVALVDLLILPNWCKVKIVAWPMDLEDIEKLHKVGRVAVK